ncbi:uncharacterized protein Z520_07772 [Fonsecaea multimorphosa CBS 102226]|uniref:Uncharacterized protein n=1 Tax=Fonsecaea multimorphosa CBS 102226 TaxID=1442371 RepID=A0A0D2IHJ8_9EURO|nr:uncharacterized protein Z520_07772 [Fonsecaea multimorphosa CBS 102226]KIX96506.1 hypothetical protein Z520_07772 [Fonsecaea multimorphosa CBS 102226]OAL28294.1 hypothetical protein AYO22_03000 [Fonsecaea multimorphosa]
MGKNSQSKKQTKRLPPTKSRLPGHSESFTANASINVQNSFFRLDKFVFWEKKTELNKGDVDNIARMGIKNRPETRNDIIRLQNQLSDEEQRWINRRLNERVRKLEEQVRSGASEMQIIAAHAHEANQYMKGAVTGAAFVVFVGLVIWTVSSLSSRNNSARTAGDTNNDDGDDFDDHDFDDGWRAAAAGSSLEKLEFAMAKLQEMKI